MSEKQPPEEQREGGLEAELTQLYEADQRAMHENDDEAIRKNTETARDILEKHGWVSNSLRNENAKAALFLAVQHSDHDVAFQQQALDLLQTAEQRGEAPKKYIAYLTDRVRGNTDQLQMFGTQLTLDSTKQVVPKYPIEDEATLDERRREYGLPPFEQYKREHLRLYLERQ